MSVFLHKKSGLGLVEVLIASALVLLFSSVLISVNLTYFKTSNTNLKNIKAIYLAEEGIEAVNFLANDWANLGTVGVNYYLFWTGVTWISTTTPNYIDQIYERKFYTEEVLRDSNGDIVLTGGVLDNNTRKLTVQIIWTDISGTTTKSISSYLTKSNE